jgi:hypothetical protein
MELEAPATVRAGEPKPAIDPRMVAPGSVPDGSDDAPVGDREDPS